MSETGLVKPKKYDWQDSNLALFGSDLDKSVKLESAQTEPAWAGAGDGPGLKIWRIEQFEIKKWPSDEYGKFYDGDSYIVLNTYKEEESEELNHDVHFWIGKHSTQDEYGTAAYKTVELDTYLQDAAVQHREVMNSESKMFKEYFERLIIMSGGAASGFRQVKPEEYRYRLMRFSRNAKSVRMTEVPRTKAKLSQDDVFVLDCGLKAFQWTGNNANKDEKYKAALFHHVLEAERGRVKWTVVDEDEENEEFENLLDEDDSDDDDDDDQQDKALFRVSAVDGTVDFSEVARGDDVVKDLLESGDVFVIANDDGVCVWVGSGASELEKKNGMSYAHTYLRNNNLKKKSVIVLKEGQREKLLDSFFD